MLENWNRADDIGQLFGALLRDFSEASDQLNRKLLIAKFNACEFSLQALKLVYDYFHIGNKEIR